MTGRDPRDDLAFMRGIVAAGEDSMRSMGGGYFAAGLCYGIQCLLHGMRMLAWIPGDSRVDIAIAILPTIIFLAILGVMVIRDRGRTRVESSTSRAIGVAFACVGMTNFALIAAIGMVAWQLQSMEIWMIYPCVVVILQGMPWLFAWMLRQRAWLGGIAAGWFATGLGMAAALSAGNAAAYLIIVGAGMFAFMAVPGAWLMRATPSSS